jgi:hypothetical protein
MTPEQEQYRERVMRYTHREQLASVMNDTKWKELVEAMRAMPAGKPLYRIKDVLDSCPELGPWDNEWFCHLWPYYGIEWIEIDPTRQRQLGPGADQTDAIVVALRECSIPFSFQGRYIRVWGYTRPGATVHFVEIAKPKAPDPSPPTPAS